MNIRRLGNVLTVSKRLWRDRPMKLTMGHIATAILLATLVLFAGGAAASGLADPAPAPGRPDGMPASQPDGATFPKLSDQALAKIEPLVIKQIVEQGQATFIVHLRDQADLSAAPKITSLAERRTTVVNALQQTADRSQRDILAYLHKQEEGGHASGIVPLWIFNGVGITGDAQTLADIANRDDVVEIRANHTFRLEEPVQDGSEEPNRPTALLWNIARIRANLVWDELGITGEGVVVASLDSGVDWTHNALKDKYRGKDGNHNYNWFDATGTYPDRPGDGYDHGTHVMGTIVGEGVDENGQPLQIGVAPGAQWISAKIFDDSGLTEVLWIHEGFQWMLAPTDLNGQNPDPAKAPDVVNNSWGARNGARDTFRPDVEALRAAGIIPVFSAGNEGGMGAGTVGSPASFPESISVGMTDPDDLIDPISSQGPSFWNEMKPEVAAPGRYVRSSVPGDNYAVLSGTSMAAPHVTGSLALMLEAARKAAERPADSAQDNPRLTADGVELQAADPIPSIDDLEQYLSLTAVDIGEPGPDNAAGAGRIDAYRATLWAMTGGKLYGFVTDSETGAPVVEAAVTGVSATNPEDRFSTPSQSDGEYSVAVPEGSYTIQVSAFGYEPQTIQNVEVVTGFLSLRDIQLKRLPTGTVAGQIRTADGNPILANVDVVGTPVSVQTDGKGTYSVDLPAGTHTLRVATAGYRTETVEVTVVVGQRIDQSFVLTPAPSTLLIDADQWINDTVSPYYEVALTEAGIPFDTRPITDTAYIPTVDELAAYDVVVWAHPWTSPGSIDQEREDTATVDALVGYLQQGGRLLLTGQDIGWLDGGGNPANPVALEYYRSVLHTRYVSNSAVRSSLIFGKNGDIMTGIQLDFDTPFAYKRSSGGFSPDEIEPTDDLAQLIFDYSDGSGAGVKVQQGNYRIVYLGFSADTTGPRDQLAATFAQAYDWLSRPVVTKSVDKQLAVPGERLTYTITIENAVGVPLENVMLEDPLPDGVEFVPNSATGGAAYNPDTRTIEWSGGILPRDSASISFQADLRPDLLGHTVVTNTATITAGDIQLEAKASTRTLAPNLEQSRKVVSTSRVSAGGVLSYTIEVINSTIATATGASLVDPIPANTQYVDGSATGGAVYDSGSREVRWSGDVPASAPEGAPYTWTDSNADGGPAFAWDDRAETQGTVVAGMTDDSTSDEIPVGFDFPFFDETFSALRVSSNGFLSFTSPNAPFTNQPLPSEDAPGNLIAPFWDDLTPGSDGTIHTWSNNVDTMVISWVDVQRFGGSEQYTFQVILRSNGEIAFQYKKLGPVTDSATIGIQNSDGTRGVSIAFNTMYAEENLATLLSPPQPPAPPPVFTFAVRVNDDVAAGALITNTARLDDGNGHTTALTATAQTDKPDLSASRKIAPETVLPGGTISYTLALSNTGRLPANVSLIDPIPAGTQYVPDSATAGAVYDSESNAVQWNGELAADQAHTLHFAVTVDADVAFGTTITNTATVEDGINPPLDLVAASMVLEPDLTRSVKFVDREVASSGDVLNYTIRLENGSLVPVTDVTVDDPLPEGLSFVPGSLKGDATFDSTENAVKWTGALPPRGEGYAWDDSEMPGGPAYAWDDRPETMGVRVRDEANLGDDVSAGPFPIGFSFPFFDKNFTEFYVSTNGFASLNRITDRYFSNRELPEPDLGRAPANLIAPYWDDLDMRSQGEIYYWTDNIETLVISWVDVPRLGSGGPYTFQAILKSSGNITFQYASMTPGRLDEATIGIQNADGTEGLTVAYDNSYVKDELAVRIAPPTGKKQFQFQAKVDEDAPLETALINTAVIQDRFGNRVEREAKTLVNTVDLTGATMSASADQIRPGEPLTYQLTIPNTGTAGASQAQVTIPLSEKLAYVDGSATNDAIYDESQHEIRWQGTIPAGGQTSFQYTVVGMSPLTDGETISTTASIDDGIHPPISRSVDVQVIAPDMSSSEKQAPELIAQGARLIYQVRLINSGHAAADVVFTDPLPAGVTYVEGSAKSEFGGPVTYNAATRTLTWSGTVPARGRVNLFFSVVPSGDADAITNTATVQDGVGTTVTLQATTRVVPYRLLLPLLLR